MKEMIRCQNKECEWWQDYTCSRELISINQDGTCCNVVIKQIVKNNKQEECGGINNV